MKIKDLKNKIKYAFITTTPELKEDTKDICRNTIQNDNSLIDSSGKKTRVNNKKLVLAACLTSLVALITVGTTIGIHTTYSMKRNSKDMSIYLDVNPSIQIDVNNFQRVINCTPLNEDANIVLENLNLKDVELETALSSIVGSLYINGYLTASSNSILVSVDKVDNEQTLTEISNQISDIFNRNEDMECSIIAQQVSNDDNLYKEAEENQISIGKMSLIKKIIEENFQYDEEDVNELASMSIQELNLIYQTSVKEKDEPPHNDIITGNPSGYINQEEVLQLVLDQLGVNEKDLRWHLIEVVAHNDSPNQRKMLYLVTIVLVDNPIRQQFYVDCVTGEFVDKPQNDETNDPIGKPRSI